MTATPRPDVLRLAALAAALATVAVVSCHTLNSFDTPWHVRTGRYILEEGIPRADPFSYTAPADRPWVNHEWGSDVLMAIVHRAAGDAGLSVAAMVLAVAAAALAVVPGSAASPLLLLVAAQAALPRIQARPHLLSDVLLLVVLRLASRLRRDGSRRLLLALIAIQAVWANLHGGFFLGIAAMGLELLAAGADRVRGVDPGRGVRELAAAAALGSAAVVANPWGLGLVLHAYEQLTSRESTGFVSEWERPFQGDQPLDQPTLYLAVVLVLAVASVGAALVRRVRPSSSSLLQILLFVGLGLAARRNADVAALGCAYAGARLWGEVLPAAGRLRAAVLLVPLLLAPLYARDVLTGRYFARNAFPGRPGLGATPALYPEGAVAWITANRPKGRMLNTYNAGGYLLSRLAPDVKVFIDGRNLVYGPEHLQAYLRLLSDPKELRNALARWDVGYVVVDAGPGGLPLLTMLAAQKEFVLVHADGSAAVLVRRSVNPELAGQELRDDASAALPAFPEPPPARAGGLLARLGLWSPAVGVYGDAHGRGALLLSLQRFDLARRELRAAAAATPLAAEVWFNLGVAELQAGAPAEAERALRHARALDPAAVETARALAEAVRIQGRGAEAAEMYRELVALAPERTDVRTFLAHALRESGDVAGAVRELRAVLAQEPSRIDVASDLGTMLAEMGERDAAKAELRGVLAKAPGYAPAAANLAAMMLLEGDHDQALALAEQALAASPRMPQALRVIAYVHLARRQLEPALAALTGYLRSVPGDLDARADLGLCLAELGRRAEARQVFESVVKADPSHQGAKERLSRLDEIEGRPVPSPGTP